MRILFDQGTPVPLRAHLAEHTVETAYERGWAKVKNSQLLKAAEEAGYDLLITTDQNLKYQQNLGPAKLAVLVLFTTSWPQLRAHAQVISRMINDIHVGDYKEFQIREGHIE
jgi:hypothetical protein